MLKNTLSRAYVYADGDWRMILDLGRDWLPGIVGMEGRGEKGCLGGGNVMC